MADQTSLSDKKSSLAGNIIAQALGFLVFVIVPAVVTAIAPVSWIKFQRQGDHVSARAEVCLFFIIPYRTLVVDPVTSVGKRTNSGSTTLHRRSNGRHDYTTQSESEGFLAIQGPASSAEVSITPNDLDEVAKSAEAFLKDPQATEWKKFVVANWKFSVLGGGLLSLLTAFYLVSCLLGLGQLLLRAVGVGRK